MQTSKQIFFQTYLLSKRIRVNVKKHRNLTSNCSWLHLNKWTACTEPEEPNKPKQILKHIYYIPYFIDRFCLNQLTCNKVIDGVSDTVLVWYIILNTDDYISKYPTLLQQPDYVNCFLFRTLLPVTAHRYKVLVVLLRDIFNDLTHHIAECC